MLFTRDAMPNRFAEAGNRLRSSLMHFSIVDPVVTSSSANTILSMVSKQSSKPFAISR